MEARQWLPPPRPEPHAGAAPRPNALTELAVARYCGGNAGAPMTHPSVESVRRPITA